MTIELLIRVTHHDGLNKQLLVDHLSKYTVIGVKEYPHSNPHYHFWLKGDLKHDTLQRFIKEKCFDKSVEKTDRKISIKSMEGNLKYLCKGPLAVSNIKSEDYPGVKKEPEIVVNTTCYSIEQIEDAHEEWWKEAREWLSKKTSPIKDVKKSKTESDKTWFEKVIDFCKIQGITSSSDGWEIAQAILKLYAIKCKCHPADIVLKNMCLSVQLRLNYERHLENDNAPEYSRLLRLRAQQIIGHSWIDL